MMAYDIKCVDDLIAAIENEGACAVDLYLSYRDRIGGIVAGALDAYAGEIKALRGAVVEGPLKGKTSHDEIVRLRGELERLRAAVQEARDVVRRERITCECCDSDDAYTAIAAAVEAAWLVA